MNRQDRVKLVMDEIEAEYWRIKQKYNDLNNPHEGYACLLEQCDELWTEVCRHKRNNAQMRAEAIEVAAVAMRFVLDLGGAEKFGKALAEVFLAEADETRG